MPILSTFFGMIIRMFFFDTDRHKLPHIHVEQDDFKAVVALDSGEILAGNLPGNKLKLVHAWIEIHREELAADWALASKGEPVFKIDPLR
ncbi:MAG: DUF4160 domain-containing protein [Alphaproteobacteria bacterium]|nr:DUF4160 domain-containing protein [Alphaproteobacteria bacterium]